MKYAIVRLGGRQFKIEEGQDLTVDHFDGEVGEVLLFVDGDTVEVGKPLVESVKIKTKVVEEGKVKTGARRFKAKSRYRKMTGHKQPKTTIKIEGVEVK